jgi:benzoate-CoA ligase family protein
MAATGDNIVTRLLDDVSGRGIADKVALRQGDRAWTYAQLADQVTRVSGALKALRISRGERVVVLMRDTLEAASSILGIIRCGGVAVPLSELSTPEDIKDLLIHANAVAALVDAELEPHLDEIRAETPALREVLCVGPRAAGERDFHTVVAAASAQIAATAVEAGDVCLLLYSAGSGPDELRAVPHSHKTLWAAFESYARGFLGMGEGDRILSVTRLATAYGLGSGLLFPLAAGAESILLPQQPRSETVFAAVEKDRPTILFATPSIFSQLTRDAEDDKIARPFAALRTAVAGAEGMPEHLVSKIKQVLGCEITIGYGLTEIFQFALASSTRDNWVTRPGVCGRPLSGVQVRVVDDKGATVGTDEIGTLQLRCNSLFPGYFGHGGDEGDVSSDGWFTTRDRFMLDAHGMYHHCGRVDDLFKVGGKWVSPGEVERALVAHESVWDCAVIGADDEDGLIKPLAFVVANVGADPGPELEAELRGYVKQVLAPYKYPRWIEFVNELPRGPGGKLLRYKLRPTRRRRRAETGHEL